MDYKNLYAQVKLGNFLNKGGDETDSPKYKLLTLITQMVGASMKLRPLVIWDSKSTMTLIWCVK